MNDGLKDEGRNHMPGNNGNARVNVPDIMRYESDIWAVADLLIAASVKQSDFPAYMMPFFALMMLEGRMRNAVRRLKARYKIAEDATPPGFEELFRAENCGFNKYIVLENRTLADICQNDGGFEQDFRAYLGAFDPDMKRLLGVDRGAENQKFLNMDGIVAELRGKKILLQVALKWAAIDLSPYDNSAITTLEEHIKRRWADISASTAGEQYTPDDIISLISEIIAEMMAKPKGEFAHIYDPTCGGANLLFGIEDRLREKGYKRIATYGSEYNDALYALAAIEAMFRGQSRIRYGNTLTTVPFGDMQFDAIGANPPYGTPWKGFASEIRNDQRGQFAGGLPSTGDGQLLFMQHILWQLDPNDGIAVVVADGSTLFSGDAGGGESNIRKYAFDRDWVEAIIQMPQQEFFNTGITTYLWVFNKHKKTERQNLVALIDASKGWAPLKKSKGDKRREMTAENRAAVIAALRDFRPSEICKIFDREHFYYNKQQVLFTETGADGKPLKKKRKDYEIIPHRFDAAANAAEIDAFVKKYIFKPCELGENKVGVEINFNKEFYVPEKLESVEDILAEIKALDAEMKEVEL